MSHINYQEKLGLVNIVGIEKLQFFPIFFLFFCLLLFIIFFPYYCINALYSKAGSNQDCKKMPLEHFQNNFLNRKCVHQSIFMLKDVLYSKPGSNLLCKKCHWNIFRINFQPKLCTSITIKT